MKPVDALITGFVKSPLLLKRSLAPIRTLRREGHIRNIHYVTWDSPELDPWLAPLAAMEDVRLTRLPQPQVQGTANQRGVAWQIRNLEAGLACLESQDGLVLKSRPDFVANTAFLRRKIVDFATNCAVPDRLSPLGIKMPPPVLEHKIWIPWADSNQPFFFEDALFLGTARDLKKLVTPLTAADRALLGDPDCGAYAHVVRYGRIFAGTWPLLAGYLKHYNCFVNDLDYRAKLVPIILEDGFFWHLLIAHAWILYSQFHVDAGAPGELQFYANNVNRQADWSRPETLCLANPYDDIDNWRQGTRPCFATASIQRAFGRLMDDAWQTALFTQSLPDFPQATLRSLMENIAARDGRLGGIERDFYARLERFRATEWVRTEAKAG